MFTNINDFKNNFKLISENKIMYQEDGNFYEGEMINVENLADIKINDIVYFKQDGKFIKGIVVDEFDEDGRFFDFDQDIKLEPDYSDTQFEIYPTDEFDLMKNLYYIKK